MKHNFSKLIAVALFAIATTMGQANAAEINPMNKKELKALDETEVAKRLELLESRVHEIQSMDLSTLSRAEKRDVKKELREIKKQNEFLSGGVYLSVGAIIIIILLLILLT
jgi:acetoin utilization deacetylase AcuC-like enzyme